MARLFCQEFSMAAAECEETLSLQGQHSNILAQDCVTSFRGFGLSICCPDLGQPIVDKWRLTHNGDGKDRYLFTCII